MPRAARTSVSRRAFLVPGSPGSREVQRAVMAPRVYGAGEKALSKRSAPRAIWSIRGVVSRAYP
jgi:hypothetical protein